jgi:hypothetical protein
MAVEVGVEAAGEGAAMLTPRAHRRHPPMDAQDGAARAAMLVARGIGSRSQHRHLLHLRPLPPSTSKPEPIDGFGFGITLNYGADPDSIRLPRKFGKVVDVKTNQVVLRARGDAPGLWTVELLFDRTGTPYLANGWRRFCQRHEIMAGHFVIFNYDGEHQIMVSVFD